jgi:hypothetical protein
VIGVELTMATIKSAALGARWLCATAGQTHKLRHMTANSVRKCKAWAGEENENLDLPVVGSTQTSGKKKLRNLTNHTCVI